MIDDALAFLKVLDSNDIPASLKDMQPRDIVVEHAEVDAVASQLRDLFKPYMEVQQQQGRGQQQNPLAMMFGGGANNNAANQIRMTLAVDNQTSILTVNSSQEIFAEVESVVKRLDEAARIAKPTVRSIQLKNADAALIQQMLTSLLPRVSVSASRSAGSGSSSNTPAQSTQGSNPAQDAINRAIQDRIRERFGGGGGARPGGAGGTGGGRPGGGFGGGGRGPGGGFGGGGGPRGGGRGGR